MATENQLQWVNRKVKERLNGEVPLELDVLPKVHDKLGKKQWAMETKYDAGANPTSVPISLPSTEQLYTGYFSWTIVTNFKFNLNNTFDNALVSGKNVSGHLWYITALTTGIWIAYDNDVNNINSKNLIPGINAELRNLEDGYWMSVTYEHLTRKITVGLHGKVSGSGYSIMPANNCLPAVSLYAGYDTSGTIINGNVNYGRFGGSIGQTYMYNRVLEDYEIEGVIKGKLPDTSTGVKYMSNWDPAIHPSLNGFSPCTWDVNTNTVSATNSVVASSIALLDYDTIVQPGDIVTVSGNVTTQTGYFEFDHEGVGNTGYSYPIPGVGYFEWTFTAPTTPLYLCMRSYDPPGTNITIQDLVVKRKRAGSTVLDLNQQGFKYELDAGNDVYGNAINVTSTADTLIYDNNSLNVFFIKRAFNNFGFKKGDVIRVIADAYCSVGQASAMFHTGGADYGQLFTISNVLQRFDITVTMTADLNHIPFTIYKATDGVNSHVEVKNIRIYKNGCMLNLEPENILPSGRWIDTSGNGDDSYINGGPTADYKIFPTIESYSRSIVATRTSISVPATYSNVGVAFYTSVDSTLLKAGATNGLYPTISNFNQTGGDAVPSTIFEYKEPECGSYGIWGSIYSYMANMGPVNNSGNQTGLLTLTYK